MKETEYTLSLFTLPPAEDAPKPTPYAGSYEIGTEVIFTNPLPNTNSKFATKVRSNPVTIDGLICVKVDGIAGWVDVAYLSRKGK